MRRTIGLLLVVLALGVLGLAHNEEQHILGTVTTITGNSITVETVAKKSVIVRTTDKTQFEKSGSAASLKDLKAGERVVIHADQDGEKLIACEVRFGAMKAKASMDGMKGMDHRH